MLLNFPSTGKLAKHFAAVLAVFLVNSVAFASGSQEVDFVRDIKPIFEKHCIACHGPDKEESFRIDDREDALAYVEPGSTEDSDLYLVLVSDDEDVLMPPPENEEGVPPLTQAQITLVKTWVEEGAKWPEDVKVGGSMPAAVAQNAANLNGGAAGDANGEQEAKPADDEPKAAANNAKQDKGQGETVDDAARKQRALIENSVGSLHPAAIHLPIGLLLGAGLFALFSLRGNFVMSDCAYYCLWLGTLGAIAACVSGWYFSPMENRGTVTVFNDLFDQDQKVFWHRTGGLAVTIFALVLAMFAASARSRDPDDGVAWKLGAILLAAGIGWVGHTGGELHYPSDHYKDLNELWQSIVNPDAVDGIEVKAEDGGGEAGSPEDEIGKASGEA